MKKKINLWEYAGHIHENVEKGVLLTTKADGRPNTMTISWGTLGNEWGKTIFTVFVRESRYTKRLLEANGEFTINVPMGEIDKRILGICGSKSGRDMDKFAELGLTEEAPEVISVPGIKELPLTLECKVIYKQDQDPAAIAQDSLDHYYAKGTPNGTDFHTAYYGQVVAAYIIE
jgi:flavin reductase (DIM6/NTAB) family NADH-FMN oxidoreductase RutF